MRRMSSLGGTDARAVEAICAFLRGAPLSKQTARMRLKELVSSRGASLPDILCEALRPIIESGEGTREAVRTLCEGIWNPWEELLPEPQQEQLVT